MESVFLRVTCIVLFYVSVYFRLHCTAFIEVQTRVLFFYFLMDLLGFAVVFLLFLGLLLFHTCFISPFHTEIPENTRIM